MAAQIQPYDQRTTPQSRPSPNIRPVEQASGIGAALSRAVAPALMDLAQAGIANQEADARIEQLRVAREEDDARVYVSSAMAQARAQANHMTRDALAEAPDGWRGVTDTVSKQFGSLREQALTGAPSPSAHRFLSQAFDSWQPLLLEDVAEAEHGARNEYWADTLRESARTESASIALNPGSYDAVMAQQTELVGAMEGLDANARRDLLASMREDFAVSAVSGLIDRDPSGTLRMLRNPDADGPFAALSGQQRLTLTNRADAEVRSRIAEARAGQAQAVASMRDAYNAQLDTIRRTGRMPEHPLDIGQVAAALGPDVAQNYIGALAGANAAQVLADRPLAELAQVASGAVTGEGSDVSRIITAEERDAAQHQLTARQTDPGGYALQNRLMRHPELTDLMAQAMQGGVAGPRWDAFEAALTDRGADAVNLRRTGVLPRVAPLSDAEASALSQGLAQLPAQARLQFFAHAQRAMNHDSYLAMMGQLAPAEGAGPVTAYAGAMYGRGTAPARQVAQTLLRGEEIQHGGAPDQQGRRTATITLPSETEMRAAWNSRVGGAYSEAPVAAEQAYQAFRAYYAGSSESSGGGDFVDNARAREAVSVATGGIVNWAGRPTLMPFGMGADQFEGAVRQGFNRWSFLREENPSEYRLRAAGGGRYFVYDGEAQVLNPITGAPVQIVVRP